MVKLFKDGGLSESEAELAYAATEPFDFVPAGSLDGFRSAIAEEARKHATDI